MYDNVTIRRQKCRRCLNMTGITKTSYNMLAMMMMMVTMLLVLSGATSASALPGSESDHLNTIETFKSRKTAGAAITHSKQDLLQYPFSGFMLPTSSLSGCPLCDSSVYSYCSHKLIHDSCCCDFPGAAVYQKPPQCAYYDCTLLYAKSCYEHSLIKNCCCNNPY